MAIGAVLLALGAQGCGASEPPSASRSPDFCCQPPDCCGVRYVDADGGVYVQQCRPPLASVLPPVR
jgi:hypothetical protein